MSAVTPLEATRPTTSASVVASAGTGKTFLLVTRLLRLLLAGADPGSILAVTFTNRAAGEMHTRLMDRARELATCDARVLDERLDAIGAGGAHDAARGLYERLLGAPWPPRVMTFHAFCQDLLARFPLEAGVPPGFELLATERELREAAWDALLDACVRDPGTPAAVALQRLCDDRGLVGAQASLRTFVAHRADWLAWTDGRPDPVAYARDALVARLGDPARFPDDDLRRRAARLCELVALAPAKDAAGPLDVLAACRARQTDAGGWCDAIEALVLTKEGKPRKQLVLKKAGEAAAEEAHDLQSSLIDAAAAYRAATLNADWYAAGHALLGHYQRLKDEARVLDFADLEWRACRLLNDSDQAHWIQYRLDRRIDHVLVDEFQDTNPTQWRMLQPLLAEIAAGDAGRPRSAFVVGDPKQAIYAFRRADSRLLDEASSLLSERLAAPSVTLAGSWRSAQAIVDCVNAVFEGGRHPLRGFVPHTTHKAALHGRVEWLDVPATPPRHATDRRALRDPLAEPRVADEAVPGLEEAQLIARRLRAMVDARMPVVGADGAVRAVGWDDVMILVRQRTRLAALELALRQERVPYASDSRGMLLERPEVLDMVALLEFLTAPWNDLQLARLLKSPLFACTDQDLLRLAPGDPDARRRDAWFPRLLALAEAGAETPALARAAACLARWRALADRIPVHDLVDRVYTEADVLTRYADASPAHLQESVRANLVQFLDLALEADAGRYPTLHRLVERLERTRAASAAEREFDDAPVVAADGRVRVMTIHAAKGLEASVVFVAQCDLEPRNTGLTAHVDWPIGEPGPRMVMLARGAPDPARAAEEDANLLYVALTRARQYLFVSGQPSERGWYPALKEVFDTHGAFESGAPVDAADAAPAPRAVPDAALSRRLVADPGLLPEPVPDVDPAAVEFGLLVHAALERPLEGAAHLARVSGRAEDDPLVGRALAAVEAVRADGSLAWLFEADGWREAPLCAEVDGEERYGVADRVVLRGGEVWVVDYKSHPDPLPRLERLCELHRPQLERYREIASRVWPGRRVRIALLFTAVPTLVEL